MAAPELGAGAIKKRSSGVTETTQSAHAASRYLKNSSGPCRLSARNGVNSATHATPSTTHLGQIHNRLSSQKIKNRGLQNRCIAATSMCGAAVPGLIAAALTPALLNYFRARPTQIPGGR